MNERTLVSRYTNVAAECTRWTLGVAETICVVASNPAIAMTTTNALDVPFLDLSIDAPPVHGSGPPDR
jgi:hypothetical protein